MISATPAGKVNLMSAIRVNPTEANCEDRFSLLIDMTGCSTEQPKDKKNEFLNRAVVPANHALAALRGDLMVPRDKVRTKSIPKSQKASSQSRRNLSA